MDNKKTDFYYVDKIVHEYGNVDFNVVYNTVIKDIPELLGVMQEISVCS
jgi:uncharacterized protein with HEPN domain